MTNICAFLLTPDALAYQVATPELVAQSLLRLKEALGDLPVYLQLRDSSATRSSLEDGGALEALDGLLSLSKEKLKEKEFSFAEPIVLKTRNWKEALEQVFEKHAQEPYDFVAYLDACCPLLDLSLTRELAEEHKKYLAHVSYGENLPPGIVPDFISWDFVKKLPESVSVLEPPRVFAFQNVETFDVELFYKSPDLRLWRLDFSCADARSVRLVNEVLKRKPELKEAGASFSPAEISDLFEKNPVLFRPFPACFEVELCGQADVDPIYRLPLSGEQLDAALYDKLLSEIAEHGLFRDASVMLGGSGDALFHPSIAEICKKTLENPNIKSLIIESYLTSLPEDFLDYLSTLDGKESKSRLHLIVRLGSTDERVWRTLHQKGDFSIVRKNIEKIEEILQKAPESFSCYAEALRMKENDDTIDSFMDRFGDASPVRPLLGKYNSFLGELPDRRAVDLTPLSRGFCWHLARDLYLNAKGQVSFCKQDPAATKAPSWDFRSSTLLEIWQEGEGYWESSFLERYEDLPLPCKNCDEWYTFNA